MDRWANRTAPSSLVPMMSATPAESAVTMMLKYTLRTGWKNAQPYVTFMRHPSIESIRLIPAANNTGRVNMAYHGNSTAADPPASMRSPTSLAVSKPRPNKTPTG